MRNFALAGVQMHVSGAHTNVPMMQYKLDLLMGIYPWVQMVVFSELCARGPLTAFAAPLEEFDEVFGEMAKKHKVWLLPGSVFEKTDGKIYNTASVYNPDGKVVGRYRKMFPFYPYEEGVECGNEFLTFDVPHVGRFGVSICYDMWFPETSRTLATMGAEVILHPTLTNTIDREIELSIARATAATNQCYIFDINGLEAGGNGQSIVCGPDGRILYQAHTSDEIIPLEIDLERVKMSREKGILHLGQTLKSWRDRKVDFEIYEKGLNFPYLNELGPLEKPIRSDALEAAYKTEAPVIGINPSKASKAID
ncbi:carbon-nitrogen hydrolase family protein [bacterium]|nr:carbon-nitrogen hydrolase family protein [bacterium]MDC1221625.1 carbon-nitrogen hydrolase family protein [Salibacteraceae bacterium]